jgi:hypothetical protein
MVTCYGPRLIRLSYRNDKMWSFAYGDIVCSTPKLLAVIIRQSALNMSQHPRSGLHRSLHQYRLSTSSSSSSDAISKLRNLIKPFLLKCHPDVHVASSNKKINLTAIQNLNAYLDTIQSISSGKQVMKPDGEPVVEVDFIIVMEGNAGRKTKKKDAMTNFVNGTFGNFSRRKVELALPPFQLCLNLANHATSNTSVVQQLQRRLLQHTRYELGKLLRIAGLPIPTPDYDDGYDENDSIVEGILGGFKQEDDDEYKGYSSPENSDNGNVFRRSHHVRKRPTAAPKTAYEKSRDRFTARIQWHNYDKLYKEAVAGMNADVLTRGLIAKSSVRRRAMIARILSNVRLKYAENDDTPSKISFTEQLVTFRRLSLLLETHFEELQMEEFGAMWESSRIVLTEPRTYNISGSSTRKRRSSNSAAESGYSFTLHPDLSVTITIPIDFHDDELIDELDSNVWDFYNFIADRNDAFFTDMSN